MYRGNVLVINGTTLPTPSTMKCDDYDITESERNANGKMVVQMIREDVHKLECSWYMLRPAEYMKIRRAIKPKNNLKTKFFIPEENQEGQILTYVGDRSTPIYTYEDAGPVYKGFTVNFIEM